MEYFFVAIIGLVIGSFLNVCIFRIPKEESISYPPSHCSTCNHRLNPFDLIPILSFIFLKGRCRYCNSKISFRYPLVESLNAVLYLFTYYRYGITIETLKYFVLISLLIVIGFIDYDTEFIYMSTTVFGFASGIIFIIANKIFYNTNFLNNIYGLLAGIFIISFIIIVTRGGMGSGDIEVAGICGLFLGLKGILIGLFLAIIIGGIIGIAAIIFDIKNIKEKMAFAPCIASGAIVSAFCGSSILNWYLGFMI